MHGESVTDDPVDARLHAASLGLGSLEAIQLCISRLQGGEAADQIQTLMNMVANLVQVLVTLPGRSLRWLGRFDGGVDPSLFPDDFKAGMGEVLKNPDSCRLQVILARVHVCLDGFPNDALCLSRRLSVQPGVMSHWIVHRVISHSAFSSSSSSSRYKKGSHLGQVIGSGHALFLSWMLSIALSRRSTFASSHAPAPPRGQTQSAD